MSEEINLAMPELVILSGMSGAGRTEAMHVFEDLGYFCVDNLPPALLNELMIMRQAEAQGNEPRKVAVVCDARSGDFFKELNAALEILSEQGIDAKIVFLEADDDRLIARYKSSRRRHPLCEDGAAIAQGIERERLLLSDIKERADYVVNTTNLLPAELRKKLYAHFTEGDKRAGLAVTVYSFGFKHDAPADADLVIDVRFLPNPYYDPEMRMLTGLDKKVHDYVMYNPETEMFVKRWFALLDCIMPGYVNEGKQHLAIAVGCTGGQHRSVTLAEETGEYLRKCGYRVSIAHRDLALAVKPDGQLVNADPTADATV